MREELRQELQRKTAESYDRARQAAPAPKPDEEKLKKQREQFTEMLFRSALRQLEP